MTQSSSSPQHTAKVRPTRTWASTVWLIPLLAAIVGGWLLVQNIRSRGPEITLLMDNAEGIEVNTTGIRVLNVEVGKVVKVRLRDDRKGVEITAKLNRDAEPLMREDTQFWVVKPRIDSSGITGLSTLVSGSYIAFTPGSSEKEAHEFTVHDLPPLTALGQSGLRIYLSGKNSKMIDAGSPVLFDQHKVGVVESARFDPKDQTVRYTVFIESPNEVLVQPRSQFWLDSGVNIQTGGSGITVNTPPLSTLLSGAIAFTTPDAGEQGEAVKNGQEFRIYNNRSEIDNLPGSRSLYYVAFFKSSVRGLSEGAPVEYKGLNIGTVADVPYFAAGDSLKLLDNGWIPVRLRIEPARLELNAGRQSKEYWQAQFQAALARGLRAELASSNLVLGNKMIELNETGGGFKPTAVYNGDTVIAAAGGSGLEDLQSKIGMLLDKFNALPLNQTVVELNGSLHDLRQTLKSANGLLAQKQTQQIPAQLNQTLAELRQTLSGVSPQSPVYQDIQQTLGSLEKTLADVRPVLDNLKEQPNSLIFNRKIQDPIPKGNSR